MALCRSDRPSSKAKRKHEPREEEVTLKRTKLSKSKGVSLEEDQIELKGRINVATGRLDSHLLADYIGRQTMRFAPDLSAEERDNLFIPAKAIFDTSNWGGSLATESARTLRNLPSFLKQNGVCTQRIERAGAPQTLVVTSSGLRAAHIVRELRQFQAKDAVIAKLFAKHIKLNEAMSYVRKTRISIGVGTPTRINDLSESSSLSLDGLERVVVDCSHVDLKNRGILDMKDTQQALVLLLNRGELKSRYASSGGIRLLFY